MSTKRYFGLQMYLHYLKRKHRSFPCPHCQAVVLPKDFEKHCTDNHGIDSKSRCVWCFGNYTWPYRKRCQHADHLSICSRTFLASNFKPISNNNQTVLTHTAETNGKGSTVMPHIQRIQRLELKLEDLSAKNVHMKRQIVSLKANIDRLTIDNRQLREKTDQNEFLKAEITRLKRDLEECAKNARLTSKITHLKGNIVSLKADVDRLMIDNCRLNAENVSLKNTIDRLKEENVGLLKFKITRLKRNNIRLKEENTSLKINNQQLKV